MRCTPASSMTWSRSTSELVVGLASSTTPPRHGLRARAPDDDDAVFRSTRSEPASGASTGAEKGSKFARPPVVARASKKTRPPNSAASNSSESKRKFPQIGPASVPSVVQSALPERKATRVSRRTSLRGTLRPDAMGSVPASRRTRSTVVALKHGSSSASPSTGELTRSAVSHTVAGEALTVFPSTRTRLEVVRSHAPFPTKRSRRAGDVSVVTVVGVVLPGSRRLSAVFVAYQSVSPFHASTPTGPTFASTSSVPAGVPSESQSEGCGPPRKPSQTKPRRLVPAAKCGTALQPVSEAMRVGSVAPGSSRNRPACEFSPVPLTKWRPLGSGAGSARQPPSRVRARVPRAVPSLTQRSSRVPSEAPNAIRPPTKPSAGAGSVALPVPGFTSRTSRVPASVPSVKKSSRPTPRREAKKATPASPTRTKRSGSELVFGPRFRFSSTT
jgi:hypothetical protein